MYNGDSIIDHPYFDGCISDLNINQNPINILGDYLAKVGTVQCTELVKRSITFQEAPADGQDSRTRDMFML
ncbi:hypothetical protein EB796_016357 [Bugula neritina]|uniref:Uncharacterized protein n=1 Tax=Bugula neritina TaxID=10212 RepID=A0A7J7JGH8_BUGNE|nr:hypothetical protein EB796_016357 [Bugula neritina]